MSLMFSALSIQFRVSLTCSSLEPTPDKRSSNRPPVPHAIPTVLYFKNCHFTRCLEICSCEQPFLASPHILSLALTALERRSSRYRHGLEIKPRK